MKAVILAGGRGTRLEPFTHVFPKPLMPIGDRPILDIVLTQLAQAGIDEAILTVGHQASKFIKMVAAAGDFGLKIRYSEETKPLGTAGPLRLINNLGTDFLVLNGDILTDLDFKSFIKYHRRQKQPATIAAFSRRLKVDFGVIETDGDLVADYLEKPHLDYLVSMGIYAFKKEILQYIPKGRRFDFPELVQALLADDRPPAIYRHRGEWLDIGRPDDYKLAVETFFRKHKRFLGNGSKKFNRRVGAGR